MGVQENVLTLPPCLSPQYTYLPGTYTTANGGSASCATLPPFPLALDVNPLLSPACGAHSLSGGDIGSFTYQAPLVYELKRRVEEKAARDARAKGKAHA
jgi:hypothetical protein